MLELLAPAQEFSSIPLHASSHGRTKFSPSLWFHLFPWQSVRNEMGKSPLRYSARSHMVCIHIPSHLLTEAPELLSPPASPPHYFGHHLQNYHINLSYSLRSSRGTARGAGLDGRCTPWPHSSAGDDSVARKCRLTGRMQHQQETCPGVMRTRCCAARAARGRHAAGLCQHGLAPIRATRGGQSRDGFVFAIRTQAPASLLQQTVLRISHCVCSCHSLEGADNSVHKRYLHQVQRCNDKSTFPR